MANRYWVGGTGTWNATAGTKWSTTSGGTGGASVPTTSDDVFFDASSGSAVVTLGSAGSALNLDCTGFTGTFAGSFSITVAGSLTLDNGVIGTYTGTFIFSSTSTGRTITTAGNSLTSNLTFNGVGGGWTFQDNIVLLDRSITLTNGSIDFNDKDVTASVFSSSNSNTRSVDLGNGLFIINGQGIGFNIFDITNLTFTPGLSTIKFTQTSYPQIISSGGVSFYNVWFAGTTDIQIEGDNTFNDFKDTGTTAHTIYFTTGSTQTVNTFTVSGIAGQLITLQGTDYEYSGGIQDFEFTSLGTGYTIGDIVTVTGGNGDAQILINDVDGSGVVVDYGFNDIGSGYSTATLIPITGGTGSGLVGHIISVTSNPGTFALVKNGGGTVSSDYLNIQHSVAAPSNTWYAGTHSTNNQSIATAGSGWIFTDPPSAGTNSGFFNFL